jgi:hypothetical protein
VSEGGLKRLFTSRWHARSTVLRNWLAGRNFHVAWLMRVKDKSAMDVAGRLYKKGRKALPTDDLSR